MTAYQRLASLDIKTQYDLGFAEAAQHHTQQRRGAA